MLEPDAPADSPPPSTIELELIGSMPTFVALRDGNGAWQMQTPGQASYSVQVTNDYEFVAVCADGQGNFDAEWLAATAGDGRQLVFCGLTMPTGSTVDVTGRMVQAGEAQMTDFASSTTAPWSFDLHVMPGTHDLVANDATRVLVRRALSIQGATTLADVDLAAGENLVPVTVEVSNTDPDDALVTSVELITSSDAAMLSDGPGSDAMVLPDDLMKPSDFELVEAQATADSFDRFGSAIYAGSAPSFALPPRLTDATFDSATITSASWTSLPAFDQVEFEVDGFGATMGIERVTATPAWVQATAASQLAIDTSGITGYSPSWNVDPTGPYSRSLAVQQADASGNDLGSAVFDTSGQAFPRAMAGRALRHARMRVARRAR